MKKITITKGVVLAFMLAIASSCDDYLDVNVSPNNLPNASVQSLLPGAQIGTGFFAGNTAQIITSLWMQQMAGTGTQTDPYDRYNVSPENNEWNTIYATLLDDLEQIVQQGREEGNFHYAGIARIQQAYVYLMATDLWGDIPFSQALNIEEFPKPVYDPQEQVYAGVAQLLDEGLADLDETTVTAASLGDQVYGGNLDRWRKAANSIKLKLYLQSRKTNPNSASAITQLVNEGNLISSNAENFNINFFASSGSFNPIYMYQHQTRINDMILSQRFYDSLTALNDPRLPVFFTRTNGNYVTYDNGAFTSVPFTSPNRSRWGVYVVGNGTQNADGTISNGGAAPIRLITLTMVNFWLAEAALTLGTPGEPAQYFRQALQAQFDDIRSFVTAASLPANFEADAAAYIDRRVAAFEAAGSTGAKLNILIRDKWASSVGNAYEAYNDYRRTGYPQLELAQNPQVGVTRIPVRWPYALGEIQGNAENVPLQDYPEGLLVPVWWMGE
ncbi:SusD/RagB family nutrient-binding outer membrane lipoprotein [Pontibacter sp. BT731]|uniref:SusD/RagB family nutrient-binding outer membrane lipoprotein n=1 Tax=Pontibacter coccineus TaxID=3063328 RepID=UPI0026E16D36|nr:SusD/RagB family nutrient-binding outer membrane lipoprotein [Pontibacter sp. BT731]MDO6389691.1 SusD/RagB family nutrient-binding outer membrane lipoprotein [Pontibacter sp. BT731]